MAVDISGLLTRSSPIVLSDSTNIFPQVGPLLPGGFFFPVFLLSLQEFCPMTGPPGHQLSLILRQCLSSEKLVKLLRLGVAGWLSFLRGKIFNLKGNISSWELTDAPWSVIFSFPPFAAGTWLSLSGRERVSQLKSS